MPQATYNPAPRAVRIPLANGTAGTSQTIALIRRLIAEGMRDPQVNRAALAIVDAVQPYDFDGEARAIYDWVRANVHFRRDVAGHETLRTAREILLVRAGDCDDINGVLLPALLGTIGVRTRLVTVATDPEAPEEFTHIYPEAWIGKQWIPIDAAMKDPIWGSAPARYFRKRIWSTTSGAFRELAGFWSDLATSLPSLTQTGVSIANAATGPSGYPMPAAATASQPATAVAAGSSTDTTLIYASLIGAGAVLIAALMGGRH